MARIVPLSAPRRVLFAGTRGGLRATWHSEEDVCVLSLWRGDACVGTHRLSPANAARLSSFLSAHVAEALAETSQAVVDERSDTG